MRNVKEFIVGRDALGTPQIRFYAGFCRRRVGDAAPYNKNNIVKNKIVRGVHMYQAFYRMLKEHKIISIEPVAIIQLKHESYRNN